MDNVDRRLQDIKSDRARNTESLRILRKELERFRLTRERQQRQSSLRSAENRLKHEVIIILCMLIRM